MNDTTKSCTECGKEFTVTQVNLDFLKRHGLPEPSLCGKCAGLEEEAIAMERSKGNGSVPAPAAETKPAAESNPTQKQAPRAGQPVAAAEEECPKCPKCEKRFALLTDYNTALIETAIPALSFMTLFCANCKTILTVHMIPTSMFQPQVAQAGRGIGSPN
jgi:hypothetical protein